MVMFLSSSFLNLTVWTPEMAFTTVDFPWATWPMVPGRKKDKVKTGSPHSNTLKDAESDQRSPDLHTNVDGGLSADDLWRERRQGRHILPREQLVLDSSHTGKQQGMWLVFTPAL